MFDRRRALLATAFLCVAAFRSVSAAHEAPLFEEIQPLLAGRCGKCHGDADRKADLTLISAEGIGKGGESGPIVVPYKPDESLLVEMLEGELMPPEGEERLTATEIARIRDWIAAGADFGGDHPAGAPVTQHDVIPILLLRCTVCHGRQVREADLDLRTKEAMLAGGKSGPAIVPGKPDESLILKRIHAGEMPPRQRLIEAMIKPPESDEIELLTQWIAAGAPEAPDEPDLAGTPGDPLVSNKDREFWAFRPPQAVVPPPVADTNRATNPIDAFVIQSLESNGLSLSPEADRLTLFRRACFDLTGLPPAPDEIDAYLADSRPDAYERLIDRLLASPRYGERWGRHWLDVAGYADCEGKREQHLPRPAAWRYRDYVIRSFNADKPYDRFLLEQLAGDELADYQTNAEVTPELEDNLIATGFLRMAPDPTWANLTGFVPDRLEVMADAIDVLGSGVMGLTFKCARCHSHKFDPIPQRDYYRLVALFKGAYDEHDWLKPELNSFGGATSASLGERYLPSRLVPDQRIAALWDRGEPSPTYIYRRGDYLSPGRPVAPGPPAVLSDGKTVATIEPPWPGAASTGRRLAFARWLTRPEHPTTARVIVNRIWKHHFGQGIVGSLGNFGHMGERPSHPELLDWLAVEFVRQGWSIKTLHRSIMTSSAYRQVSAIEPLGAELDPDNRLLSRMPLRRIEAEALRDSLLFISGRLDESRFGPADPVQVRPDGLVLSGRRRSIYVEQLRKHPPSLLESFDLPAMNPNCLSRSESLVAPQALHLLNDAAVRDLAAGFADRVFADVGDDPARQIERVYLIALTRQPTSDERDLSLQALNDLRRAWQTQQAAAGPPDATEASRHALATYCHTIFNAAEFLYLD